MPQNSLKKSPFDLVVQPEKLNPKFKMIQTSPAAISARAMVDEIFQDFSDPDGNFVEQFQTTGFDTRYFELYLFAYFSRSGFEVDRSHPNPDFLVSRNGLEVAVEATTTGPSWSGVLAKEGSDSSQLQSDQEHQTYVNEELPIRLGSSLFSKLKKRYWDLDHVRDKPLVLAVQTFHDTGALSFSDSALAQYLYGLRGTAGFSMDGSLNIKMEKIAQHSLADKKTIPSNFFAQETAQNISAILFTNSGTQAKFSRMGYQAGIGCDEIDIIRSGFSFNPHPDAIDPTYFYYNLDHPPFVEPWSQGLVVIHNPHCIRPVPPDFFVGAVQTYLEDGNIVSIHSAWHPIRSITHTIHRGEVKRQLKEVTLSKNTVAVEAISKSECHALMKFIPSEHPYQEDGWFADSTDSFLGVLTQHIIDGDWGYVIFARDQFFRFHGIEVKASIPTRIAASQELQIQIAKLLNQPQRIFHRENLSVADDR